MKTKTTLLIFITVLLISLYAAKTNAQIVYVDIDPDTTIYVPDVAWNINLSNYYLLDLNNDSINEFSFIAQNYYNLNSGNHVYGTILRIYSANNYVAGVCSNMGNREDIFFNELVNSELSWDNIKYLKFDLNDIALSCDVPIGNTYIGLMKIEDIDTLYGWGRCTATNNSITIKDFAYNTIPNMPILAGQTELGIGNFAQSPNINIYENSGYLYVNIAHPSQAQGNIRIYSQQGVLVKAVSINEQQNSIPLVGLAQGIYIVQVATKTEIVNKQIFLQGN